MRKDWISYCQTCNKKFTTVLDFCAHMKVHALKCRCKRYFTDGMEYAVHECEHAWHGEDGN